jgi:hypothetical protein
MNGTATEEQIKMVEWAKAQVPDGKLPPLLGTPNPQEPERKASIWDEVDAKIKAGASERTAGEKRELLTNTARGVLERERDNQRKGGLFDRVGLEGKDRT